MPHICLVLWCVCMGGGGILAGGTPILTSSTPILVGRLPYPGWEYLYPDQEYPYPGWDGTLSWLEVPLGAVQGYPLKRTWDQAWGYPHWKGPGTRDWGTTRKDPEPETGVPPERTWDQRLGYTPGEQTNWKHHLRHLLDTGGKNMGLWDLISFVLNNKSWTPPPPKMRLWYFTSFDLRNKSWSTIE